MKKVLCIALFVFIGLISYSKNADTTRLYFDIGKSIVTNKSKSTLDSLLYNDIIRTGKKVGIIGYADYVGTDSFNITLSNNRANAVKDYLLTMGISQDDIQLVTGKGEIKRLDTLGTSGFYEDRRVDILPGGIKGWKPAPAPIPVAVKDKSIDLSKAKKNETIKLNKIFFEPGRHVVREESQPELEKLYQTLVDYPTLKIRIEGHICCLPNSNTDGYDYDTEEFKLSENRAEAIYDYLIDKGINESRIQYKGFGSGKPLAYPEKTPEDEMMNRRVEIRILEK
ncbi:MAG: OmpA family protein [Bacteroidetes bacterium]|nr:OmpA family protein [Bacteroidota bacterium]